MATIQRPHKSRKVLTGDSAFKVVRCCTVERSPETLFNFWRHLENLPLFMEHLLSVTQHSGSESHWKAKGPLKDVEWDAVIIAEEKGRMIAWRSKEGSQIRNAGSVYFEPAPYSGATEVKVQIEYDPPLAKLGATFAKFYGEEPGIQVDEDLR